MCVNKCKNYQATASWVASNIMGDVKENLIIKSRETMWLIEHKFSLSSRYNMAWSEKEKAKEMIFDNVKKSYDYME